MARVALEANLCYNPSRNIVVSEGAENTTLTLLTNLLRRLAMSQVYHAQQLPLFPSRVCTQCNIEKHLDQFHKAETCKDGHRSYCKDCAYKRQCDRSRSSIPPSTRVCKICRLEKPIDQFYRSMTGKSGFGARCKDCYEESRSAKHGRVRKKILNKNRSDSLKWCYKCETEKPLEEFSRDKGSSDGYMSCCKPCHCAQSRLYHAEHREEQILRRQMSPVSFD